jgi:hypothetical protein
MRNLVEENMDSGEQLSIILAAPKMRILPCREILNSRATAFISVTARHFENK